MLDLLLAEGHGFFELLVLDLLLVFELHKHLIELHLLLLADDALVVAGCGKDGAGDASETGGVAGGVVAHTRHALELRGGCGVGEAHLVLAEAVLGGWLLGVVGGGATSELLLLHDGIDDVVGVQHETLIHGLTQHLPTRSERILLYIQIRIWLVVHPLSTTVSSRPLCNGLPLQLINIILTLYHVL